MSDLAIGLESVGKKYRLRGQSTERYLALRDVITQSVARSYRTLTTAGASRSAGQAGSPSDARKSNRLSDEFWALSDVSAEIPHGDVVGLIGRNGAGKSTLLKILSRVTEPTAGIVRLRGRLSSLLEVGTGFHPELTGRENIFLNGAIMGMTRAEIHRKFDEIVSFAEVDRFLDTPVKRYSSGMYVRLAFAVAAHLDSEILLVDEVLAVGDAQFQKKCLGKMADVGRSGQTVVLVSHNLQTIQSLCRRCLVLESGKLIFDGTPQEAVRRYLNTAAECASFEREGSSDDPGGATVVGGRLSVTGTNELPIIRVELDIASGASQRVAVDIRLKDSFGAPVGLGSFGALAATDMIALIPPLTRISFEMLADRLATGAYYLSVDLTQPGVHYFDRLEDCLSFELTRFPRGEATTVLPQDWHYGSFELPLTNLDVNGAHSVTKSLVP